MPKYAANQKNKTSKQKTRWGAPIYYVYISHFHYPNFGDKVQWGRPFRYVELYPSHIHRETFKGRPTTSILRNTDMHDKKLIQSNLRVNM